MSLKIIKNAFEAKQLSKLGKSIGFVPTMGSLHEGHLSLIKEAQKQTDIVVVSIFVNPTQFNNPQDFALYPHRQAEDIALLKEMNVDYVFLPEPNVIYPNGYSYQVHEIKDSEGLCGSTRPGHFQGVLTVLMKFFNLINPQKVFMGLKDYQQWKLVEGMVKDFFMDIEVVGVDTVRDDYGLALSSRNLNLSEAELKIAREFAEILKQPVPLSNIQEKLEKLGVKVDYLEERWGRRFAAVFVGTVRLIDNIKDPLLHSAQTMQTQDSCDSEVGIHG